MNPTVKVHTAEMERWLVRTAAATGAAVGQILPQQMGLLAKDLVAGTPPFAGGFGFRNSFAADKRVGQLAVERDIRKVYATTSDLFDSAAQAASGDADQPPEDAGKAAARFARRGDGPALRALMSRLGVTRFSQASLSAGPDPAIHRRHRGARGRVHIKNPRQIVTSKAALNAYIRRKKGNVGRGKKGWSARDPRFAPSGLPAWFRGQATAAALRDQTRQRRDPSATIGNLQSGAIDQNLRFNLASAALAHRVRKMQNALRAKMRGAWRG